MKVEVRSMWDDVKHRPNVWLNIEGEGDVEVALLQSLYSVRPKVIQQTSGAVMIDFYPDGEPPLKRNRRRKS